MIGGIIGWIIIGALAGWIAEKLMKRDHGLMTNIIVGIVGAFIGGGLLSFLGFNTSSNWFMTLITAVIGACILLWIVGTIRAKSSH